MKISYETFAEDILISFGASFLTVLLFNLYRAFRGISFETLNRTLSDEYLKFGIVLAVLSVVFYLSFFVFTRKRYVLDVFIFVGAVAILWGMAWLAPENIAFNFVQFILLALVCSYIFVTRGYFSSAQIRKSWVAWILIGLIIALYTFAMGWVGFARHKIFQTSGYDLGIFNQMYYFMNRGFAPITTIPGEAINHMFTRHFSPILYVLLPIYWLFPNVGGLIFGQAFMVAITMIPIYLICRKLNFPHLRSILLGMIFVLQPGILGGIFKDFHELALFPFFFFAFVYFWMFEKRILSWVFFALCIFVKEDAPLYMVAFGLFWLFYKKAEWKRSICSVLIALIYFFVCSSLLTQNYPYFDRYASIIPQDGSGSYLDLIKVFLTNPLYIFSQSFIPAKMEFLGGTLIPMAFTPVLALLSLCNWFLFLPLFLLNLLTSYAYQYSLDFQYNFAPVAVLFVSVLLFFTKNINERVKRSLVALMICATVLLSVSVHQPKSSYFSILEKDGQTYRLMENALSEIPQTASVSATNQIYAHLSGRDVIYPTSVGGDTQFIVLDLRPGIPKVGTDVLKRIFDPQKRYGVSQFLPEWLVILKQDGDPNLLSIVKDALGYE